MLLTVLFIISIILLLYAIIAVSLKPKTFPRLAKVLTHIPPVLLILGIIISCFWAIHPMNIFFNLLCIFMVVIGLVYFNKNKRAGFYIIVSSALLHVANSFFFMNGLEIVDTDISLFAHLGVDGVLLLLFTLMFFLKNKEGVNRFSQFLPITKPSQFFWIFRVYYVFSITAFVFALFLFPSWRTIHESVPYYHTYYNEYNFYDSDGNRDYTQNRWVFCSPVDGQVIIEPGYYHVYDEPEETDTDLENNTKMATIITKDDGSTTHVYVKLTDGHFIDLITAKELSIEIKQLYIYMNGLIRQLYGNKDVPPISHDSPEFKPDCKACNGTGDCYHCGGRGTIILETMDGPEEHDCEYCVGGHCANCYGTGEYYENAPVYP